MYSLLATQQLAFTVHLLEEWKLTNLKRPYFPSCWLDASSRWRFLFHIKTYYLENFNFSWFPLSTREKSVVEGVDCAWGLWVPETDSATGCWEIHDSEYPCTLQLVTCSYRSREGRNASSCSGVFAGFHFPSLASHAPNPCYSCSVTYGEECTRGVERHSECLHYKNKTYYSRRHVTESCGIDVFGVGEYLKYFEGDSWTRVF